MPPNSKMVISDFSERYIKFNLEKVIFDKVVWDANSIFCGSMDTRGKITVKYWGKDFLF